MSFDFTRPVTSDPAPAQPAGQQSAITKDSLVGRLVVFTVKSFDPDHEGSYGPSPQIDVEILVADGPNRGLYDPSWRTWGNLARQMGAVAPGRTAVARVAAGKSGNGRSWYGLDWNITDRDIAEAKTAADTTQDTPF